MKTETQTLLISILVFAALMLAFIFALFSSGIVGSDGPITPTAANIWGTPTDEIIPAEHISITISGTRVKASFTGSPEAVVRWNFGDGVGSTSGHNAYHNYSNEGNYLITMYEVKPNGQQKTEYIPASIDAGTLATVGIPETNESITLAISSLIIAAISSLILALLSLYFEDIPPRAFTFKQRVTLGIGLLFIALLALGHFNGIFAAG